MPVSARRVPPLAVLLLAVVPALSLAPGASGQYFGRNKVQWERFDWKTLKTEHFDIYYYADEAVIADAGRMAERWYGRLTDVFGFELVERRSIILYADPSDFQQTTVVGGLIGEGTGGLTEPLRTRVVMPLAGTYEDTDHVLGHELVHVFQFQILLGPENTQASRSTVVPPLWWIEGLAEYLSLGRESALTAMWLRDALLRDELPEVERLSRDPRLFPYRWGHAFWAYVGGRWGDRTATQLFTAGTQIGIEAAIRDVLGLSLEDFSAQWKQAIASAYGPALDRRASPREVGRRVLPREGEARDVNVSPELSPDGSELIFLSTRSLFTFDLYLADAKTGEIKRKLLSADSDPHFEALRFIDSSGSWSPDGRKFAFAAVAEGDSRLAVLDVASRDVERRFGFDEVDAISNPAWSPDGRSIAFSGIAEGVMDLYLVDLESGALRRLTNDRYAELHPAWSPDGRTIAFATDRRGGTDLEALVYAPSGIRLLDVAGGGSARDVAPFPGAKHIDPQFSPDGRDLYFISDRGGVSDVYRFALESGEVFQVTRAGTGIAGITELSPALSVAGRTGELLFSVFYDTDYYLQALAPAEARGERVEAAAGAEATAAALPPLESPGESLVTSYLAHGVPEPPAEGDFETDDYDPGLSLEYLGPAAGVTVSTLGYGFGGSLIAQFGDVLGQRSVGAVLFGQGGEFSDFGGQVYYLNQEQRFNWGGSVERIPYLSARTFVSPTTVEIDGQEVPGRLIQQVRETVTETGGSLIAQYPFSTTRRFEVSAGYTRLGFEREVESIVAVGDQIFDSGIDDLPAPESLDLYQGTVAFVGDSSYYGFTSPVRGQRYRFEIEPTFGSLEFQSALADYRRYQFWRPVTLAVRGLHYGRYGTDAESERLTPLYIGYPTLVRGYELGSIDIAECTTVAEDPQACPEFDRLIGSRMAVANLKLRVPLFGTEGFGLIELPFLPTELSAFVDAGVAWTKDQTPELRFDPDSIERVPVVSAGLSARLLLGGFAVLEFYYAKPFQRPEESWVTGFTISPGW